MATRHFTHADRRHSGKVIDLIRQEKSCHMKRANMEKSSRRFEQLHSYPSRLIESMDYMDLLRPTLDRCNVNKSVANACVLAISARYFLLVPSTLHLCFEIPLTPLLPDNPQTELGQAPNPSLL